ncbi:MAG: hypothetical protein K0S09_802 [Sphingobacteriaceae bacterium]|jgi:hypothetical protein|nr:hypothetical protein [Sphingobacteriaceae bacterium]
MLLVVLPLKPLSLQPMFNSGIISSVRKASSLKTIILGLLVTCLLLSTCAVRKSIEAFLQGSVRTESSMASGVKKIRATNDEVQVGSSQLCSADDETTLQNVDAKSWKALDSVLPLALFLPTLLGLIAAALLALLHNAASTYFSKASFAFNSTPLYIKNRLLLI